MTWWDTLNSSEIIFQDYQESSTLSFTGYVGSNSLDTDPGYVTMPTSETTGNSISRSTEKVDEIHFSDEPHFLGIYYDS